MKRHILVVDDEKEFRFAVGIALRKAGYRAEVAGDGREALAKIREAGDRNDPFSLVVLDLRMPTMSGVELIEQMSRERIFIPVIVMTCFVENGLTKELQKKGCFDILEKPFRPQELVERIVNRLSKPAVGGAFWEPVPE